MPAAAQEEILASLSAEEIFSLAAGVAAALDPRTDGNAHRGQKPHQGIFSKNRTARVSATWVKWSGTHQVIECCASKTVLGPTIYLYDGMNLIEEVDISGNVLARYAQSGLIDEPLAMLRSATTSYYQVDGLGSSTSLSTVAGALANTYTYDSFGKLTASTGTVTNPFRYTGREFDSETGIYEYRARYHDPNVGRFTSEDPIEFGGGVNFYRYVRNNPLINIDPAGLDPSGLIKRGHTWNTRINCAIAYWMCLAGIAETRQSLDQMTDNAVTNTSDAMGSQGGYSNQRLKCGLTQDKNCQDALDRCIKMALTNPFPPLWWLKDLISLSGGPTPKPPAPTPKP